MNTLSYSQSSGSCQPGREDGHCVPIAQQCPSSTTVHWVGRPCVHGEEVRRLSPRTGQTLVTSACFLDACVPDRAAAPLLASAALSAVTLSAHDCQAFATHAGWRAWCGARWSA